MTSIIISVNRSNCRSYFGSSEFGSSSSICIQSLILPLPCLRWHPWRKSGLTPRMPTLRRWHIARYGFSREEALGRIVMDYLLHQKAPYCFFARCAYGSEGMEYIKEKENEGVYLFIHFILSISGCSCGIAGKPFAQTRGCHAELLFPDLDGTLFFGFGFGSKQICSVCCSLSQRSCHESSSPVATDRPKKTAAKSSERLRSLPLAAAGCAVTFSHAPCFQIWTEPFFLALASGLNKSVRFAALCPKGHVMKDHRQWPPTDRKKMAAKSSEHLGSLLLAAVGCAMTLHRPFFLGSKLRKIDQKKPLGQIVI